MTVIAHVLAPGVAALAADGRQFDEWSTPHDPPDIRKVMAVGGLLVGVQGAAETWPSQSITVADALAGTSGDGWLDILESQITGLLGVQGSIGATLVFESVLERCWSEVEVNGQLAREIASRFSKQSHVHEESFVVVTCAWVEADRTAHARRIVHLVHSYGVAVHSDERWCVSADSRAIRGVIGPHPEATDRLEVWLNQQPTLEISTRAAAERAALQVIGAATELLAEDPDAPGGRLHAVSVDGPCGHCVGQGAPSTRSL